MVILLDAFAHEYFRVILKRKCRKKSMSRASRMQETSRALESIFKGLQGKERDGSQELNLL